MYILNHGFARRQMFCVYIYSRIGCISSIYMYIFCRYLLSSVRPTNVHSCSLGMQTWFQILGRHEHRLHTSQDSKEDRSNDRCRMDGSISRLHCTPMWLEGPTVARESCRWQEMSCQSRCWLSGELLVWQYSIKYFIDKYKCKYIFWIFIFLS